MVRYYFFVFVLSVVSVSLSQAQWTALSGPPGGTANDIEIDAANGKIYAIINNEKLFVSANEGASWTEKASATNLYPYDMLVDGSVLYFVSYSAFYKSEDGGDTWSRVSANGQFTGAQKVFKSGSTTFFTYGYDGLYISEDSGVNWEKLHGGYILSAVVSGAGDLYFSTEEGIMKHAVPTAGGQWDAANTTQVLAFSQPSYYTKLATDASGVYAVTDTDVLKSSNGGSTWPSVKTATITESYFYNTLWAKAGNGLYLISYNTIYYTGNGGTAWTAKAYPTINYSSGSITEMKFLDNNKAFAATYNDGVFKTTDAAATWNLSSNGINMPLAKSIAITSSGRLILGIGYYSKGFWYSDNQGGAWTFKLLTNEIQTLKRIPNNTLLGLGYSQLQYSTDNGSNWTVKADNTYIMDVAFNTAFSAGNIYGVGFTRLAKSTDGITWSDLTISGLPTNYSGRKMAQDDSGNLYVLLYNSDTGVEEIYVVKGLTAAGTTGAATLLTIPLGEEDAQYGISVNSMFVSNNKLYVGSYYYIYISANQGTSFTSVNFSKNALFPLKKGTDHAICAATNGSLYTSQDDGKTWISTSLPTTGYSFIADIAEDANGDYYGAGYLAPVMKFTNELVLPAASLPPYIDFNWQPTNGPYGGNVSRLWVDNTNTNIYAHSNGKIYKAAATVNSWTDKSGTYYFNDLEIDKSNNKLYAITYDGLYTSTTGGDTWTEVNSENIYQRRYLRRCPNGDLVFNGSGNTVYVSTDGGVTFGAPKFTSTTHNVRDIVVTSGNAILIYLRENTTPFAYSAVVSTDRGVNWGPVTLHNTTSFSRLSAGANGNIYSSANPMSKSSDNGANWTSVLGNLPTNTFIASKVFTSPAGELYFVGIATGSVYSVYKSTDSGANWTKQGDLPGSFAVNDIAWIGTRMVLGTNQTPYISDDDGATFTAKATGITFSYYDDLELAGPSKLLVSTNNLGFSTADGTEWAQTDMKNIYRFLRKPDGTLLGYSYNTLYSTPDQGATWTSISSFPGNSLDRVVTPDGTTFYGTSFNKIYVTSNLTDWTELVPSGMPANFSYQDLAVDSNGFIYALVYNNVVSKYECYQIVFGAAAKLNRFTQPSTLIYRDNKLYLYESSGSISSTTDGSEWTTQSAPSGDKLIIANNNYYFVTQYGGSLWLSRDQGASWQNVGLNATNSNLRFSDIVVNDYNGYAYATIDNSVVRKSANIVIPPETVNPIVSTLAPANSATDVLATTTLNITFNEACIAVNGKKIRIFNVDNTITPVEILDATAGTQDGKTFSFTPASPLGYEESYFIIVDNGAFTDIFGNPFAGITNNTTWRFTVQVQPDAIKPVISYSPVTPAFVKGATNKLQVTVTDEGGSGVDPASIKVHYRGIMASGTPAEASLTNSSGNTFEVTVPDAWLDELGLEFIFEARDNQGNVQVSPADALTNSNYHKGYFTFAETSTPALPSSVLSFGGEVQNYRIFSIPHKLTDAKISTVFDELPLQDVKQEFRILRYTTESDSYSEYPTLSTISRGLGYWINVKNSVSSVGVEGATTPDNSKTQLFTLALKPGWNQIGNPYPFTISWEAVRTADGNANIGVLKSFNGSTFVDDDKLNMFEGGFVLLNGTATINVTIPFSAKTTTGRTGDKVQDFQGGWMLPLTLENSKLHTIGGVGMHPEAQPSFDRFDDAMPPKIFDIPEISFPHSEHFIRNFTRDVVPTQDRYVWDVTVRPGEEKAVLRWDVNAVKALPNELYMLDEQNQKLIDMASEAHCELAPEKAASFRIFYGYPKDDIKPSRIQLGKPFPNPFTSQSSVAFTLPESKAGNFNISLDVYDMMGRKIATVARGEFPSGFYVGEWTPEPGSLNASLYLYRLTVYGNNNIVLTEKIINKK